MPPSFTTRYVHSPLGGILSQHDAAGAWHWALVDGLGSVRDMVDEAFGVEGSRGFAPYGLPMDEAGGVTLPFAFTGEPLDGNGLQYHRARYYNPRVGVFPSLDALEVGNRYAYVGGNVVNRVDPSGWIYEHPIMCGAQQQDSAIDCPTNAKYAVYLGSNRYTVVPPYRNDTARNWNYPSFAMLGNPTLFQYDAKQGQYLAYLYDGNQVVVGNVHTRLQSCSDSEFIRVEPFTILQVVEIDQKAFILHLSSIDFPEPVSYNSETDQYIFGNSSFSSLYPYGSLQQETWMSLPYEHFSGVLRRYGAILPLHELPGDPIVQSTPTVDTVSISIGPLGISTHRNSDGSEFLDLSLGVGLPAGYSQTLPGDPADENAIGAACLVVGLGLCLNLDNDLTINYETRFGINIGISANVISIPCPSFICG